MYFGFIYDSKYIKSDRDFYGDAIVYFYPSDSKEQVTFIVNLSLLSFILFFLLLSTPLTPTTTKIRNHFKTQNSATGKKREVRRRRKKHWNNWLIFLSLSCVHIDRCKFYFIFHTHIIIIKERKKKKN